MPADCRARRGPSATSASPLPSRISKTSTSIATNAATHAPRLQLRADLTAYDAAYVALAELLGCELLTGERRLADAPGPRCTIRLLT